MGAIDVYALPGVREPVSCLTHLLAVPVFALLGCVLIRRGSGRCNRGALATLAVSSLLMLSMSSIYHLLAPGTAREMMLQLDTAGIFVLIAGTVTPVHVLLFRGFHRWAPVCLAWLVAVLGITLRFMYWDSIPSGVGNALFLIMGWGGALATVLLWRRYGFGFVSPLLWGGVAYTAGFLVLSLRRPVLIPGFVGSHELWHVAVLFGLGLHWSFVFQFAAGPPDGKFR